MLESGLLRLEKLHRCFPQGVKSYICIIRCRSTSLERRAVFLREESLLFVLFVAARRIWNVVPFSSGRKYLFVYIAQLDVLFDFPPLDEFGTSWRFPQGGKTLFACDRSTERHINFPPLDEFGKSYCFYREKIRAFVLLSSLDEFGASCLIFSRRQTSLERLEVRLASNVIKYVCEIATYS